MKALKFVVPLLVFAVLVGFFAVGLKRDPREVPSPLIGKPAPSFALSSLQDAAQTVGPEAMKGKVWVLNVWASWCAPCRDEHPLLVSFAKQRRLPIVGLNYKDTRAAAQRWLQSLGDPYELSLFDEQGRVGLDFGVYGVPETFIIDREGVVRLKHVGPLTPDVMQQKIEPMLKALNV